MDRYWEINLKPIFRSVLGHLTIWGWGLRYHTNNALGIFVLYIFLIFYNLIFIAFLSYTFYKIVKKFNFLWENREKSFMFQFLSLFSPKCSGFLTPPPNINDKWSRSWESINLNLIAHWYDIYESSAKKNHLSIKSKSIYYIITTIFVPTIKHNDTAIILNNYKKILPGQ